MKLLLLLFIFSVFSNSSFADEITRSIEYTVSSDQSLNEARENAINQLKVEVLGEYGALVQSEVVSIRSDKVVKESVNFSQISGGYVKASVKEELFDGSILYLLVELDIDISSVKQLLSATYKEEVSTTRISELIKEKEKHEKRAKILNKKNQMLKIELKSLKSKIDFASKALDNSVVNELQIEEISNRIKEIRPMIEHRIKSERDIAKQRLKLMKSIYITGMTNNELSQLLGDDLKPKTLNHLYDHIYKPNGFKASCTKPVKVTFDGYRDLHIDFNHTMEFYYLARFRDNSGYRYIGYFNLVDQGNIITKTFVSKIKFSSSYNTCLADIDYETRSLF